MFEHRTEYVEATGSAAMTHAIHRVFQLYEADGWELVAVCRTGDGNYRLFLKRPKLPETPYR